MVKHTSAYTLGDGSAEGTTHGPVQNQMQYDRVKTFFDDIKTEGWKVAVGGDVKQEQGYFLQPTIIDRPPEKSRIVAEEPFGMTNPIPIVDTTLESYVLTMVLQAPSSRSSRGATRRTSSPAPTTPPWASARRSGPTT